MPSPAALAGIASLPEGAADPYAAATLHALLRAGDLVDHSDGVSREAAVGTTLAVLPHPAVPACAVPRLAALLGAALGAGGEGVGAAPPPAAAEAAALRHSLLLAVIGAL
jgi:hypothetical protein